MKSEYKDFYEEVEKYLRMARDAVVDLQVLFEDDENQHDMATVEDIRSSLEEVQESWRGLPNNLLGDDLNE